MVRESNFLSFFPEVHMVVSFCNCGSEKLDVNSSAERRDL